jgi:hypothetical protein
MCISLEFGKRDKKFYRKTEFSGTRKIVQKLVFLRKNLWELLDAIVLHIFESAQNSASFGTLHAQFRRNFFSTLIKNGAVFLEVKSSNKIENDQYFKKHFFILVLGFQGRTKIT